MTNPWPSLRHERTVRRVHDWQHLLGAHYTEWAFVLQPIACPIGIRFFADFGAGEAEYELSDDSRGFVALPMDGATPHRMNATEAEFARADVRRVLSELATAASTQGKVESLRNGVYSCGRRSIAGRNVLLLVAPGGIDSSSSFEACCLAVNKSGSDLAILLTVDTTGTSITVRERLAAANVAISELPLARPWRIDWSPLLAQPFRLPPNDPPFFFGALHAVIVDPEQQRIWLEGRELPLRADGHGYRMLAYLAEHVGTSVPSKHMANKVLETDSSRTESRIVSEVKGELLKVIASCLVPTPHGSRVAPPSLVVVEQGRVRLNIDPSLVKVIRRLSDR